VVNFRPQKKRGQWRVGNHILRVDSVGWVEDYDVQSFDFRGKCDGRHG
jgi:hypothetical protein